MRALVLATTLIGAAGCGEAATVPSADAAVEALRSSLDAWQAGKPASLLSPGIEAVDFEWKAGKKLTEYALGDDAPGQGARALSVTLTLKGEAVPKRVEYMVFGQGPVRVYRDEDYQRAMNMDNAPAPAVKKKGKR